MMDALHIRLFKAERRVTRAARSLLFSEQSVEQIAEATAFGHRF